MVDPLGHSAPNLLRRRREVAAPLTVSALASDPVIEPAVLDRNRICSLYFFSNAVAWIVPGVIVSLIATVFNAWVLLVEIFRSGNTMRQLIAGNWKMHGLSSSLTELEILCQSLVENPAAADVLVCPPASLIARAHAAVQGAIGIGAQDCHAEPSGAYTGDISAEMLKDAGAGAVIVGHSERRQYHDESDATVAAKARGAWRAGLTAIICVGETEQQRENGEALDVVARQLDGSVPDEATASVTAIAYEPVWAIGTGKTPTAAEIAEVHGHVRQRLALRFPEEAGAFRILYGGSVKPANAREILSLPDVDGALVGGASLKAVDFLAIIEAVPARS